MLNIAPDGKNIKLEKFVKVHRNLKRRAPEEKAKPQKSFAKKIIQLAKSLLKRNKSESNLEDAPDKRSNKKSKTLESEVRQADGPAQSKPNGGSPTNNELQTTKPSDEPHSSSEQQRAPETTTAPNSVRSIHQRCTACDRVGCCASSPGCPFYLRPREIDTQPDIQRGSALVTNNAISIGQLHLLRGCALMTLMVTSKKLLMIIMMLMLMIAVMVVMTCS